MALFKSGNPTLSENRFRDTVIEDAIVINDNAMTVRGTLNKFGFLFLMTLGTAYYSWHQFALGGDFCVTRVVAGTNEHVENELRLRDFANHHHAYVTMRGLEVTSGGRLGGNAGGFGPNLTKFPDVPVRMAR